MKNKPLFFIIPFMILAGFTFAHALEKTKPSKEKSPSSSPTFSMDQKDSLKGIKGLAVFVEALPPEMEKSGISADQLKTDVEARLKKAGIKLFSEEGVEGQPPEQQKPTLYINFIPYTLQKDLTYGYSLNVYFNQVVLLQHNPKLGCLGTTWHSGGVGIIRANKLKSFGQGELAEHIDKFIHNFLAVNPK
jgi:hypothetical protein